MKKILPEYEYSNGQLNIISDLAKRTGLCAETIKILYGRGIDDEDKIERFIHPSKRHFVSPYKMSGMKEAAELIARARDEGWQVVVYGDYDADGVCATTIMRGVLERFGIDPVVYVPERTSGYGLGVAAIDAIFEEYFPQLFITVDCGISNAAEVDYIKEQGAEVIVTDHHELPEVLPDCICINPKINDGYPYDNLCGAGVAFKVGCALIGESAYDFLDFAAIATVADSVPLTGENRDIVYEGLKIINKSGDKPYSQFIGRTGETITAQTIAFAIAPKINAAGRMGDAHSALELFCSEDASKIYDLSVKLTAYNSERQKCCDELYLSAKNKLKEKGVQGRVIMLWDESWNTGFVGIVAARLAEEFARPALLFVKNGEMLKGSARSVEAVNIFEALRACSDVIAEFGGHSQAAGVNIEVENFSLLEQKLNEYLDSAYPVGAFAPTLYISGELTSPVSQKFAKELEMLEPFGVGFKRPLFCLSVNECTARPIKPRSPHLSIKSRFIDLMYFSGAAYAGILQCPAPKKLIFEYNISTFRGKEYVKGFVRDVIYDRDCPDYAKDEIALNNLSLASLPEVGCEVCPIDIGDARDMMQNCGYYGTLFVAFEPQTLSLYKDCRKAEVNLFTLSNKNLASAVLVSPLAECDISGYENIVFLDKPANFTQPSLEGKKVYVCQDADGAASLRTLSADRQKLIEAFRKITAAAYSMEGTSAEEAAAKAAFGMSPAETLFALKVFEQLGIISFESGRITVYKGMKTQLTQSPLYNLISGLNG